MHLPGKIAACLTSFLTLLPSLANAQAAMRIIGAPSIIRPGSSVTVVVDYQTPIPNNVVISLLDNNYTWKAGTSVAVAAGAGQTGLTLTAPSNLVPNDNFILNGYLDEDTGNWQNPDATAANYSVKVRSSVNANLVDHKVVASNVAPNSPFRFCVSYAATGAKEIKLNIFKGSPGDYSNWRVGVTQTVGAGSGTLFPVEISLTDYAPGNYFAAISLGDAGATSGLVYGSTILLTVDDPTPKTVISPTDLKIRYIGRFKMADPAAPEFDWPGTYIQVNFTGTSLGVKLESPSTVYRYRVFVDGAPLPDIVASVAGNQTYTVATGLANGTHSVEIHKKNEDDWDIQTTKFRGFVLDQGASLVEPDAAPTRKILVIGDSYTVGYGASYTGSARSSASHSEKLAYDDTYVAYGPQIARHYGADYQIIARSGIGVYCKNNSISPDDSMRNRYDNTHFGSESPAYAMSSFVPQLIIINLGINDFATWSKPSAPTQEQFETAYKSLIDSLRGHYPGAKFLLVTQASAPAAWHAYVQNVATAQSAAYQHVALSSSDLGLDWHPNIQGQTRIANALIAALDAVPGGAWETLSSWRTTHFGSPANSGAGADLADPDGDGTPNLIEYACGTAPDSAASRPETPVSIAGDRLAISFDRLRADLIYTVQASNDLAEWLDIATNPGALGESVTVVDSQLLSTTPRRFLRLKVTPSL